MVDDDRSLELKRRAREVSFVSERLLKVRTEVVRLLDEPSGKTIVQQEARRQKSVRLARAAEIRKLPKADQAFETLQRTFDAYDVDGNGGIDAYEFSLLLRDLSIPLSQEEAVSIHGKIDTNGNGQIDFLEFSAWHSTGTPRLLKKKAHAHLRMKVQKRLRDASGQTDLLFARRALVCEASKKARSELVAAFRQKYPPVCELSVEDVATLEAKGNAPVPSLPSGAAADASLAAAELRGQLGFQGGEGSEDMRLIEEEALMEARRLGTEMGNAGTDIEAHRRAVYGIIFCALAVLMAPVLHYGDVAGSLRRAWGSLMAPPAPAAKATWW
jgi:hypothetical protein